MSSRVKGETSLQAAIVSALFAAGYFVLRVHSGLIRLPRGRVMHLAPKGFPDLAIVGRNVYLEVKTDDGELSEDQHSMHLRIRKAGGKVYTVRTPREALEAVRGD